VFASKPEEGNSARLLGRVGLGETALAMPIPLDLCSTEDHAATCRKKSR
jgi:hypothetical protein